MRKKITAAFAAVALMVSGLFAASAASADPPAKVWVCKYVGTPGVNEALKRGNDGLVEVSANTLGNQEIVVGASFPDAQGRSLVVQIGGDRPLTVCPGYVVPTPTLPVVTLPVVTLPVVTLPVVTPPVVTLPAATPAAPKPAAPSFTG